MSIADKITSITTHLEADYEGLENLGADLTNVNKNIQNIRTCLDNIYSSLPKTTGEGSNLSLSTLKGRINVDDILGDTEQEGTPTPSSPQDINVVTGTQEVVVQNRNLLAGIELGDINSTTGAETSTTGAVRSTNYIPYDTETYYYASVNNAHCSVGLNIRFYNKNKEYIGYGSSKLEGAKNISITITTSVVDTTPKYFKIRSTLNGGAITSVDDKVLISTTNDYSYIEHQEQTKTLHLGDIELGGIGTYKNRIFETSGKNLTDIVLNGSTTGEITYKTYTLQPNTQYTISTNTWVTSTSTANVFASSGTSFSPSSSSNGVNGSRTITSDNNGNITIGYRNVNMSMDYSSGKYWVMLNEGSTALPYEPYGSDKWYIEKKMYKIANKTNWVVGNMASNNRCPIPLNSNGLADTINSYNGINCISNCLIATSQGTQATSTDINTISINNANAYVKFDDATNTKELVKAKLNSMTNFVLYYILITPTYEEITNTNLINELNELEKMMSYLGQTNISVTGSLPMILDVTALKGE